MRRIPVRGIPLNLGESITLSPETAHYVRDVLRLDVGARLEVFGTDGDLFEGIITSLDPLVVTLDEELDGRANESPCAITLYQAIPKSDRFEWVLEKSTELGVARIVPIITARSVVKVPPHKADAKLDRWQKICDAAARQCGRAVSPTVESAITMVSAAKRDSHPIEIVLDPSAVQPLTQAHGLAGAADVAVWIGPEGGFDERELELLAPRTSAYRMGPRVLRSETAGIVAVAIVQVITGGFE